MKYATDRYDFVTCLLKKFVFKNFLLANSKNPQKTKIFIKSLQDFFGDRASTNLDEKLPFG
jgi:hypothetical protein